MGNTRDTGYLQNIIKSDNLGRIGIGGAVDSNFIANLTGNLRVTGTSQLLGAVTSTGLFTTTSISIATGTISGIVTAPTAIVGTNTTQLATTAFVLANTGSIPHLEFDNVDKTVWNNGKGDRESNTVFGQFSLINNTTGQANNAFGGEVLANNTTGSSNIGIGRYSLYSNISGSDNIAIGDNALTINETGSVNIAIGDSAGIYGGATGFAGNTTPSFSIYLGHSTRALGNNQTNQIVIGTNAVGAGSNTVTLGNTSITSTILRGTVNAAALALTGALTGTSATFSNSLAVNSFNGLINFGDGANSQSQSLVGRAGGQSFHVGGANTGDLTLRPEATKDIVFGTTTIANASGLERFRIAANGHATFTSSVQINDRLSVFSNLSGATNVISIHGTNGAQVFSVNANGNATFTGSVKSIVAGGFSLTNEQLSSGIVDASTTMASVRAVARFHNNGSFNLVKIILTDNAISDATITYRPSNIQANNILGFSTNGFESVTINGNGAVTAASYITSSDISLKTLTDLTVNPSSIKAVGYKLKADLTERDHFGYIAQEIQEVMPFAVHANEEGILSVDYTQVLVAKVQYLEDKLQVAELRLQALEIN